MSNIKKLYGYSQTLSVLYVEDDEFLRADMHALLSPLFKSIDMAEDGVDGFEKYNNSIFDIVITDINMPRMNGIEMIEKIREMNPEQKILSISAHNEGDILINIIKAGVNSFILKPVVQEELVKTLYPVCRDAFTQNMNIELVQTLNDEKELLLKQNKELKMRSNTIDTKHHQLETLLKKDICNKNTPTANSNTTDSVSDKPIVQEYFQKDEDEGYENIILLSDHCSEITDMFTEIPELIGSSDVLGEGDISLISLYLRKTATIFMYYSPYVDLIAESFNSLSQTIINNTEDFRALLDNNSEGLLMLFDAISSDMERYVERFSVESLAMRNSHHIHRPTALSIQQVIDLISPSEADYGDIELF